MKRLLGSSVLLVVAAVGMVEPARCQVSSPAKPRVVITADPELDDNNSLVRLILYTTDFRLEGLVYTSSEYHWKGDRAGTTQYIPGREYARMNQCLSGCTSWRWPDKPEEAFIDHIVDAYAKVYENLKVHDKDYPTPASLKAKIAWGNLDFEGDYSHDTAGSHLIKKLLLDNKPGPLYVTAQGGQSTIARALKSIYDEYHSTESWPAVYAKVSQKLVIVPSGDQDGAYPTYIKPNWPDVEYVQLAGINYSYAVRNGLAPENVKYPTAAWTKENISDRGPLGALYRVWGDGRLMVAHDMADYFALSGYTAEQLRTMGYAVWTPPEEKGSFIGEGDTPTYINFLNNGLRAGENSAWGGWGGIRRVSSTSVPARVRQPARTVGPDDPGKGYGLAPAGVVNPNSPNGVPKSPEAKVPAAATGGGMPARPQISVSTAAVNADFFGAAENDFAARLKWSITPSYKEANHAPVVEVKGALDRTVKAGDKVDLTAQVLDPDGNAVSLRWWQYRDAGSYPGEIALSGSTTVSCSFAVPADAQPGQTIHVIAEAKDDGVPSLTRYRRVILTVK